MATQKSLIIDRNGTWYTHFSFKGRRVRKSLGIPVGTKEAKQLAEELAAKRYHELFVGKELGQFTHLWEDAAIRYYTERVKKLSKRVKKSPTNPHFIRNLAESKKDILRKFAVVAHILEGKDINDICQQDITDIKDLLLDEKGLSEATVNRHLAQFRSTLIMCRDLWENDDKTPWLERVPKFVFEEEPEGVIVSVTEEKLAELYNALPEVQQDMMLTALQSGLRDTPLRLMEKTWINFELGVVTIPGNYQKNRKPVEVPLPPEVLNGIIRSMKRFPESKFVFATETGKPIFKCSNKRWYAALEKVGLKGEFKWHHLRHLFASNHISNGTPESVIQRLGGWVTPSMVKRYAHTDGRNYKGFAESAATNLTQLADYVKAKAS